MSIEKDLLQQAINSILHGYTQTYSDGEGREYTRNIGDLRVPLVNKLVEGLLQSDELKNILIKTFTEEVCKGLISKVIETMKYSDLPYSVQESVRKQMSDVKVEVRKYKVVAEVIDEE